MVYMIMAVVGAMGLCMFLLVDPKDRFVKGVSAKQYNHMTNMGNAWLSSLNSLNLESPLAVVRLKRGQPGGVSMARPLLRG